MPTEENSPQFDLDEIDNSLELLIRLMHDLTSPEVEIDAHKLEIIRNLGASAHNLFLAREGLLTVQEPTSKLLEAGDEGADNLTALDNEGAQDGLLIVEPASLAEEEVVVVAADVQPDETAHTQTEFIEVERVLQQTSVMSEQDGVTHTETTVVETGHVTEEQVTHDSSTTTLDNEITVESPEAEASESPSQILAVEKLEGVSMSDEDLSFVQSVIEYLSDKEDRIALREILRAVKGTSRIPRNEEAKIVNLLDAYSKKGILRSYGKTYGYRTDAERATDIEPDVESYFEQDLDITDFDLMAVAHIAGLIADRQPPEINIGEFVRTFYRVDQLEKGTFISVIERLNELARRGYLTHAQSSPWYGKGSRTIQKIETTEDVTDELEEAEAVTSEIVAEREAPTTNVTPREALPANEAVLSELDELEAKMFEVIKGMTPGEWFSVGAFDWSEFGSSNPSARSHAFVKLTSKLIDSGLMVWNGKQRGGRKVAFVQGAATPESNKSATVVEDASQANVELDEQVRTPASTTEHRRRHETVFVRRERITDRQQSGTEAKELDDKTADLLVRQLDELLTVGTNGDRKVNVITENIATKLNVTPDVAREWINNLVQRDQYHIVSERGRRYLVKGKKPETAEVRSSNSETATKDDPSTRWSDLDISVAQKVFTQLLELTHVQQGIEFKDIVRAIGGDEQQQIAIRRSIRRLEQAGFILLDRNANMNTRSDRSKKIYSTAVKFSSQAMKMRAKYRRQEIIDEIRSRIEADSQQ